jgi:hypothetical protein
MPEQHSAEWQHLMEAWRQVEGSQAVGPVTPEVWQAWRTALTAWRKTVAEEVRAVQSRRHEWEERRKA